MSILQPKDYPNQIPLIKLTVSQIEHQIRNFELSFSTVRNRDVEWKMKFPMFVPAFYNFVLIKNSIPTQNEYWSHYLLVNSRWFELEKLSSVHLNGLQARVFRTYPSLIRDIHFSKYVYSQLNQCIVIYNQKLDIEEGIDLLVIHNDVYFAFNLFTDTNRAYSGRFKKNNRHINFENVEYIDLPVNLSQGINC